jgi:hypothetical protein
MFEIKNTVSGVVILSASDRAFADAYLDMVNTVPSSHEIVEVEVVTE